MTPEEAGVLIALAARWSTEDLAEEVSPADVAYNHALKQCARELTESVVGLGIAPSPATPMEHAP